MFLQVGGGWPYGGVQNDTCKVRPHTNGGPVCHHVSQKIQTFGVGGGGPNTRPPFQEWAREKKSLSVSGNVFPINSGQTGRTKKKPPLVSPGDKQTKRGSRRGDRGGLRGVFIHKGERFKLPPWGGVLGSLPKTLRAQAKTFDFARPHTSHASWVGGSWRTRGGFKTWVATKPKPQREIRPFLRGELWGTAFSGAKTP